MTLYEKIYSILYKTYIPIDRHQDFINNNKLINDTKNKITKLTAGYYSNKLNNLVDIKFDIIEDIASYSFYENNKNHNNNFDLHNLYGNQIDSVLDAIFDYCYENDIYSFNLITGCGTVIKPKTLKYLRFYDVKFKTLNKGIIKVI